ncbi:MAG TPA: GTPase Era [Actinomycetota bacterium]|nr:GTPase Era [Actinomycetota bacterium]
MSSRAGEGVFRSGFVAVVGRPNVGKSSLINALVGRKVAIVSDKPQTTRLPVRGVLNGPDFQIVFTDTPGFHKPRTLLGERLNLVVGEAVGDVDEVLLVVDGAAGVGRGDAFVAHQQVARHRGAKVCAVNKIDLLRGHAEVPQLAAAAELASFDHIVPVSARTRRGLDELRTALVEGLPIGQPLYPMDQTTDQPLETRIAEIVREKALALAREELPHSIAVAVDEVERDEGTGLLRVSCHVFVERDSQKGIVIGKGGATLKEIGTRAREELETLLETRVFLELRVKVLKEWQRDPKAMARLGL